MPDVILEINQKSIPLNDLMKEMLTNIIMGYLKSAKKVPEDIKSISIDIHL
jgi:hypothetical protein